MPNDEDEEEDLDFLGDEEDAINLRYRRARAEKMVNDAEIKAQQKEIERLKKEKLLGSLIPLKDATEVFAEIGARTKARCNRLIGELPPKLEGLTAVQMIEILRNSFDEMYGDLFKEFAIKEIDPESVEIIDKPQPKKKRNVKDKTN
jgi:hypothetical protein